MCSNCRGMNLDDLTPEEANEPPYVFPDHLAAKSSTGVLTNVPGKVACPSCGCRDRKRPGCGCRHCHKDTE